MKVEFCAPARLTFHIAAFLFVLQLLGSWCFGLWSLAGSVERISDVELKAEINTIRRRLAWGEANMQREIFPEGRIFCWSFYGFALVNLATTPNRLSQGEKNSIQQELLSIIHEVERVHNELPYSRMSSMNPPGGIILAGHINLLRGGYLLIGGQDQAVTNAFHKDSEAIYASFMGTKTGSLESYPGVIWPCDNCCALFSLRLHDKLFGTAYGAACTKWEEFLQSHPDESSGMMPASFDKDGRILDGPRGNALSWSLAFMPVIAPNLCREQYAKFRHSWYVPVMGMIGVREWYPGSKHKVDQYDSLVIGEFGAASSGLGIGASRANGDLQTWRAELRGLEAIGFPCWTLSGEKTYLLRRMLLADVLALWGKTINNWNFAGTENFSGAVQAETNAFSDGYWSALLLSGILSASCIAGLSILLRRQLRLFRQTKQVISKPIIAIAVLQLLLLFCLCWSGEVCLLALMSIIAWLEDATVRPHYVRIAFEK